MPVELAVGIEALGADELAVLEVDDRFLHAIVAHGAQTVIGDDLAGVGMIAIHEGVFFGLPVIALELVGIVVAALLAQNPLQVLGDSRGNEAVGLGRARAVHVFLDQPHAPLAVHGGQVHLARFDRRQDDMGRLADLAVDDVHIDREQPARLDRADDGIDQFFARRSGAGIHRLLHHIGAAIVFPLEDAGIERRLVVVVGPDVMHLALARDQQLIDVGRRAAHMGIRRPHIAFLVTAETAHAAAFAADIAGGERNVHQRADGAIVVVAPDDALLVGGHAFAARAIIFRLGDPFGGLDDVGFRDAADRGAIGQRHLAFGTRRFEAAERCRMGFVQRLAQHRPGRSSWR